MKDKTLKVNIIDSEDKKDFNKLMAELQVAAVMKMCPRNLRKKVLDRTFEILTKDTSLTNR